MNILVLKLNQPNSSYRLSKNSSFSQKNRKAIIAFGFVRFDEFRPITLLKTKHIVCKVFSRATE